MTTCEALLNEYVEEVINLIERVQRFVAADERADVDPIAEADAFEQMRDALYEALPILDMRSKGGEVG